MSVRRRAGFTAKQCPSTWGPAIGAGHTCRCVGPAGHEPYPGGGHGCGCGAGWSDAEANAARTPRTGE